MPAALLTLICHVLQQLCVLAGAPLGDVARARPVVLLQFWRPPGCEQRLLGGQGVGNRILWSVEHELKGVALRRNLQLSRRSTG